MKRFVAVVSAVLAIISVSSCIQFDDSEIQSELSSIKSRLTALENKVNTDISGLWEIVNAQKDGIAITSVTETDDSWILKFGNGKTATVSKGGTASAPVVGVKKDADGIYYWTLYGQWLLDSSGNKLPVTGADGAAGAPGVTPQLKIEGGDWYVSADGGKSWTRLGKATGEDGADGDAFFKEVRIDEKFVYVTMSDGTEFVLRRGEGPVASIAVIPDYSDGAVKAGTGLFTIRFKVEPASAADGLLDLDPKSFKLDAVYTLTKAAEAGDFISLPIHEMDAKDGILTVTTDGEKLEAEFASKKIGLNAALFISDGNSLAVNTGYFPLWPKNEYMGHEYVDFGLESGNKFADINLGAENPGDPGNYYAWGELEPKDDYDWNTYLWCNGTGDSLTKYTKADGFVTFEDDDYNDDAARKEWGGEWRTPTAADWAELLDGDDFTWTWTYMYGNYGYEVKCKKPGHVGESIFLPASGFRYRTNIIGNDIGYYWSSSLDTSAGIRENANTLCISSSQHNIATASRVVGMAVRPVLGKYVPKNLTGLGIDCKTITLAVGMVRHLNAKPVPENARLPKLAWNSDNAGVATVSQDGTVTAISPGTAVITVKTSVGAYSASCTVTVKNDAELAPEAVDLGLPSGIKWASKNIGATVPEDYGDYFAWGETAPYYLPGHAYDNPCKDWKTGKEDGYYWTSYIWNGAEQNSYTKYGSGDILKPEDDAARKNWGEEWRMPTRADFEELADRSNCNWAKVKINDVYGIKITSKKNGNAIFLPAADYRWDKKLGSSFGYQGLYLSSSLDAWWPYSLYFDTLKGTTGDAFIRRECGMPIRPVQGEPAAAPEPEPDCVDLGLGVKWATCNLGASKPEEFGDYFAWGETEPYYESGTSDNPVWKQGKDAGYDWPSYRWCDGAWNMLNKYNTSVNSGKVVDYITVLEPADDAASVILGDGWRIPSEEEFNDLLDPANCSWTWTTENGVAGFRVASLKPGYTDASIFLPAAGSLFEKEDKDGAGEQGLYWTRTLAPDSPRAWARSFFNGSQNEKPDSNWYDVERCSGLSIRPVFGAAQDSQAN